MNLAIKRRQLLGYLGTLPLGASWHTASYATPHSLPKQINVMAAFNPGGGPDTVVRTIAAFAEARFGIHMVIRHMPQVHGETALAQFLELAPDGKTWLMCPDSLLTANPHIYPRSQPDPLFGLTPVGLTGSNSFFLMVRADDTIQNMADFVQQAKSAKQPMNYASGGVGSMHHLYMVDLANILGLQLNHVAYQGGAKAAAGLARGDVRIMFGGASSVPLVESGKLRILAVDAPQRLPRFADVPAIAETLPNFTGGAWWGWFGRLGTSAQQTQAMAALLQQAMNDQTVQTTMTSKGAIEPGYENAEVLTRRIRQDFARFGRVVSLVPGLKS